MKLYRIMYIKVEGKGKGDFDIAKECLYSDKKTMILIVDDALSRGFYAKIRIKEAGATYVIPNENRIESKDGVN